MSHAHLHTAAAILTRQVAADLQLAVITSPARRVTLAVRAAVIVVATVAARAALLARARVHARAILATVWRNALAARVVELVAGQCAFTL